MGKHEYTKLDRARDELFSHIQRCDVLESDPEHRMEWLGETMEYMRERYPELSDLQHAQLEMFGRQYLKPPIQHGRGRNAITRDRALEEGEELVASEPAESEEAEPVKAREAA